ncbi:VOC family protein [Chitinimonas naiadis]
MIPSLDRVDHIHVYVTDRTAAEQWYGRVMGLQRLPALAFWAPGGGPLTLGNASDTVHLALFERPPAKNHATVALAVSADGFLAWQRHLAVELGQKLKAIDHAVSWSMYFCDPDGNPFEITSYAHAELAQALAEQAAP